MNVTNYCTQKLNKIAQELSTLLYMCFNFYHYHFYLFFQLAGNCYSRYISGNSQAITVTCFRRC